MNLNIDYIIAQYVLEAFHVQSSRFFTQGYNVNIRRKKHSKIVKLNKLSNNKLKYFCPFKPFEGHII